MNRKELNCTISDCDKKQSSRGLCKMHVTRLYRTGTTDKIPHIQKLRAAGADAKDLFNNKNRIPLTKGAFAVIDEENFDLLNKYSWHLTSTGYAATRLRDEKETFVYMHRMILGLSDENLVDHINRNKLDNRKVNLRACTNSLNLGNQDKRSHNCLSKFKGVTFDKRRNRWIGQIVKDGKRASGRFATELEAAQFYNTKATELFGDFARLNNV